MNFSFDLNFPGFLLLALRYPHPPGIREEEPLGFTDFRSLCMQLTCGGFHSPSCPWLEPSYPDISIRLSPDTLLPTADGDPGINIKHADKR